MGMRLIKNISPVKIKVNISLTKLDGQHVNFDLMYGDSVLSHDTGVATKSIIIQKKKGNIDIVDEFPEGMIPYQVYKHVDKIEDVSNPNVHESETYEPVQQSEPFIIDSEEVLETETKAEAVETDSLGKQGRPKGSNRKPLTKAQINKRRREQYKLKNSSKE